MEVDMRSEDASPLAAVNTKTNAFCRALTARIHDGPKSRASRQAAVIDTIGIRSTGAQVDLAPIVLTAQRGEGARFTSSTSASSTDANIPISLGVPGFDRRRRQRGRRPLPRRTVFDGANGLGPQGPR